MLSRKRPRVSSATGTWKPRKKIRLSDRATGSSGLRTGGWRGVPGRRGELKYVDVTANSFFTEAGAVYLLNGLVPGTGASQRIGKKAVMKTLQFRASIGALSAGAEDTIFQGIVRFLWIYDKQSNATAPTLAQIFEQTDSGTSFMNMDNRDRFVVLADRQIAMDQSGGHPAAQIKMYKKINLPTIFNAGTAGTIADITSGSIYLVLISDSVLASPTQLPDVNWTSRFRYDDS